MSVRVSILSSGLLGVLLISVLQLTEAWSPAIRKKGSPYRIGPRLRHLAELLTLISHTSPDLSFGISCKVIHWIMTLVKVFSVRITTSEFSTFPLVALNWIVLVPLFRKLT